MRKKIRDLENRLAVLEFEKEANGCTFIVEDSSLYIFPFPEKSRTIKFLSEDKSKVITIYQTFPSCAIITQNGKYLEIWSNKSTLKKSVVKAMRVSGDTLVDMDVDVYNKAFYPEKRNHYAKPIIDIAAETKRATDALDALTYIVKSKIAEDILKKS